MKQLEPNPYERLSEKYPLGTIVGGRVRNIADFGIFVEIEEGVEGLVHISELAYDADAWQEKYPVGLQVKAEVIHIDSHDRKISLSERGAQERAEGGVDFVQKQGDAGARLGDVMGDLGKKFQAAEEKAEQPDSGSEPTDA
jgi:small subunit ribosomal protein S1